MPGHKRNAVFGIAGAEIDITEIDGFDNLHGAGGVIKEIEDGLSEHYKSRRSFLLVNGSTVGILSAIFAVCGRGDKIIIARNCHKSVFGACYLLGLKIAFAEPEFDSECGYYTKLTQGEIDRAAAANPDAKAVVITSPTYEGIISDITCRIPLIVDAAHGAHLGIDPFPAYPAGDIVISSLHKTLPALTQTAVANIFNDSFSDIFKRYLDIFETSSPSYVLMNSVDICLKYLKGCKSDFEDYHKRLEELRKTGFMRLKIKDSDDIGKVIVSTASASIGGSELADILRKRFGIEVEGACKEHIILMTSVADGEKAFEKLKGALLTIDGECDKKSRRIDFTAPPCPENETVITISDGGELVDLDDAAGQVANEYIFAYPPDIPIVMPGEIITGEITKYIRSLLDSKVNVISDSGNLPKVLTKKR